METTRKRKRSKVANSKRHRSYTIPKAIDEYGRPGCNAIAEGSDTQKGAGDAQRTETSPGHRGIQGTRPGLLLEGNGARCNRLLRKANGYPCENCRGAIDVGECDRIREVTESEMYDSRGLLRKPEKL